MTPIPVQTKTNFVVRWICATTVGWILALLAVFPAIGIWEIVTAITWQHFREKDWYRLWADTWLSDALSLFLILMTMLLMGTSLGFAQWQIALKGKVDKRVWIFSSALIGITGTIGITFAAQIAPSMYTTHSGILSGLDTEYSINSTWIISVAILGGTFGISTGLPQWLILRHYYYKANRWLLAVIAGSVAVFASLVVVDFVIKIAFLTTPLNFCCISPTVFGAITGAALYDLLKQSKRARNLA
jgi:hypothetical protein